MKLIVQIPCHNEEETLPQTVADIPYEIEGIDRIEILIVDDGCTDRTVEVAREIGVHHIVRNRTKMGLAGAFRTGLDACLHHGADIIVNTDGDNQYAGGHIPMLIRPILDSSADIVVGDRQPHSIAHFSSTKKWLQTIGSYVIRKFSGIDVPDAVSGFRAISRSTALQMNIVVLWATAHQPRKPSFRWLLGRSCTNIQTGPLKGGRPQRDAARAGRGMNSRNWPPGTLY